MTKRQQQIIGAGLLGCLLLLAAGFFLLVKPKKSQVTSVKAETASEQTSNATLQSQITMLQQQQAGLVGKQVVLRQVAQRIPSDPAIPSLIRQLTQIHTDTGVDVVTITPGMPTAASAATAAVAAAPAATATATAAAGTAAAGSSGTAASGTAAAGTTSTTGAAAVTHPGAASTSASYQTIPVTLSVQGNYSQLVMFLDKIENLQRLYLVKSISLTPMKATSTDGKTATGPNGSPELTDGLSVSVTGEVYETSPDTTNIDLPALNGATAGAAAATPSASPTTTVH